jgi:hypothetical protein
VSGALSLSSRRRFSRHAARAPSKEKEAHLRACECCTVSHANHNASESRDEKIPKFIRGGRERKRERGRASLLLARKTLFRATEMNLCTAK